MTSILNKFILEKQTKIKELAERFSDYMENDSKIGFVVAKNRVEKWIENFDNAGFRNFNLLLELLDKIELIKSDRIQQKFVNYYNQLNKSEDIYIAPLGEISESSFRLSSIFNRKELFKNSITDALNEMDIEKKKHITSVR